MTAWLRRVRLLCWYLRCHLHLYPAILPVPRPPEASHGYDQGSLPQPAYAGITFMRISLRPVPGQFAQHVGIDLAGGDGVNVEFA
jgi:hypothetical protein